MNQYIEEDLLPQVAERLEYTQGVLSKLKKYQNKQLRENTTHFFKETDFWNYAENYHPCLGYHYYNRIIDKYVNKPFSHVIAKCRNHILYKKHKGFKLQVDQKIKEQFNRPQHTYQNSTNFYYDDYYLDDKGILRDIKDHPEYFVMPHKERILYQTWRKPHYITTSYKRILKEEDTYYFVSTFEDTSKLPVYKKDGVTFVGYTSNPNYFKIPLTISELCLYGFL